MYEMLGYVRSWDDSKIRGHVKCVMQIHVNCLRRLLGMVQIDSR